MEATFFDNTYTTLGGLYSRPERIDVLEVGESIHMVYMETSQIQLAVFPPRPPEKRVFKIVYSCVDGKWNISDRIYGKIMPPLKESYIFEI